MPAWITVLSGLLAPVVAIFVAWIAYQQWRTARSKLNLDLFDKRMDVYEKTFGNAPLILRKATHVPEAQEEFFKGWRASQFLFGPEVSRELEEVVNSLFLLQQAVEMMSEERDGDERQRYVGMKWTAIRRVDHFRQEAYELFRPYMHFDEKRVRTISEWLAEKNRQRLSHGDPPN